MAAVTAREVVDGQVVVVGLGLSKLFLALAQRTHAPNLHSLNGNGATDPLPTALGVGNADPRYWVRAVAYRGFADITGMVTHRGLIDVAFLGALEVDQYGNANGTEVRGPDGRPRRLGGGGGANDLASHARATVLIVRHEPRKLVERVFHNTSPGFIDGPEARGRAGLPGGGPRRVITDKCVFGLDTSTGRLALQSIHPGVTTEQLIAATGFPLEIPPEIPVTIGPTKDEVRIMREELSRSERD
jgi:glutaconate CoA-transferase, subunit B